MTQSNRQLKASIHAVIGGTGSGKTTTVLQAVKRGKPTRIMVWDTKGEFALELGYKPVRTIKELSDVLLAAGVRGQFKVAFQPSGDSKKMRRDFSRFCLLAFYRKNVWVIAEELSDVTDAGWSPEGWKKVVTQGRTEGVTIYGLSQSPALIDKTFFTNCTSVQSGRVNSKGHARVMADVLDCKPEDIMRLEDGQFIRVQFSPRLIEKGSVFV